MRNVNHQAYEDNYVILEAIALANTAVNLDLLFDRFRWAELSLGFACTGNSFDEKVSWGLWELNDVTGRRANGNQSIQAHVNLRSVDNHLPLRPLFAVWDLALPSPVVSNLHSIIMKRISGSGASPIQRDPLPNYYSKDSTQEVDGTSWNTSVAIIDRTLSRHQMTEQAKISVTMNGKKVDKGTFRGEGFRPAIISSHLESIIRSLPHDGQWCVEATQL